MSKLILKLNDVIIQETNLNQSPMIIGREPNSDIVIDDILVSRHHAKVFQHDHCYYVEDLDSGNGILVNDNKITKKVLQDLDDISIGKYTLTFKRANPSTLETDKESDNNIGEKTFVLPINRPEVMALQTRQKSTIAGGHSSLKGTIVILSGREQDKAIELTNMTTVGGKNRTADIKLQGLFVGKNAFTISKKPEGFFIAHIEGKRMTKVNGSVVIEQKKLQDGDLITIGPTKMKFSSDVR